MVQEAAREILIRTKRRIFSSNLGNNATAFVGNGLDFSELREYHFGDDVRKINWKATAREQRPYINLFTEERELNIVLALMVGGGIAFGSARIKQEAMTEIMAMLGFSALKNGDNITPLLFSDHEELFRRPTKNSGVLHEIVPEALALEALGKRVDYAAFCDYALHRIKRRSILFVIGDFLEEGIDLSSLSARNEIYAVVVRDRFEESPRFEGTFDLIDPSDLETGSFTFDRRTQAAYEERIRTHDKRLAEHFLAHRISYTKIYTDEDPWYKLNNLVK